MELNPIRRFRKERGLSLEQVAEQAGMSFPQLSKVERGLRQPSLENLRGLSRVLQVPLSDLTGEGHETVPLVGFVKAGAEQELFQEGQGPFEQVLAPEGATETTVAVEIRGESLGPFFDRWLVYYDRVERPPTDDLLGRLCVIGLPDGRTVIKKLQRSRTRGLFHLISATEAPMLDEPIEWAAPVKVMMPRG